MRYVLITALLISLFIPAVFAQEEPAVYQKHYKDPVLEEMKESKKSRDEAAEEKTDAILEEWKERKKKKKDERVDLKSDFTGVDKPASLEEFTRVWHNPPVPQYYTGTCWSFAGTSYFESEVKRVSGREVKLSELHTVYYEYLEKARGFIQTRGNTHLGEGSEANAVTKIFRQYGAVPLEAYPGVLSEEDRHDHRLLFEKFENYLNYIEEKGYWDEEEALSVLRVYLNATLGTPPETFTYDGKEWTPETFLKDYLRINTDDYVEVMSTKKIPFWTKGEFEVPDNWWHSEEYHNLPLGTFYTLIKKALENGYSVGIGGDVSSPGYYGFAGVAIIPGFDIPQDLINQDSRELRIANSTTDDDHGIHLVGHTVRGGHDWFLIKDSGRSSRWGDHKGYYFYRDDYVKIKMLTFTVHRDMFESYFERFEEKS